MWVNDLVFHLVLFLMQLFCSYFFLVYFSCGLSFISLHLHKFICCCCCCFFKASLKCIKKLDERTKFVCVRISDVWFFLVYFSLSILFCRRFYDLCVWVKLWLNACLYVFVCLLFMVFHKYLINLYEVFE